MNPELIDSDLTPRAVLERWPRSRPLAALWSGGGSPRARWTILAEPEPGPMSTALDHGDAKSSLHAALSSLCNSSSVQGRGQPGGASDDNLDAPPFVGGWIGLITYDQGRDLEPTARPANDRPAFDEPSAGQSTESWPGATFFRCNTALAYDHGRARWWSIGRGSEILQQISSATKPSPQEFQVGPVRSRTSRARFLASVERVLDYIRAGDVYQVNLAHQLIGSFCGSSRALFATLADAAKPWYGGYLELQPANGPLFADRRAALCMSPELFVEFDPRTRSVLTRPMKGTRPGHGSAEELWAAPKDNAELAMIVDLMRNDLGRVCSFGSVHVSEPRLIERHGSVLPIASSATSSGAAGVLQAVAEVQGTLRPGLGIADLLVATLPGGSVTGAPKVRAMQIIDELEPVARGPYCGCVGFISDGGHAAFNIAIRTALVQGRPGASGLDEIETGTLCYSVGAGMVADSDPESEWRETLDKASVLEKVTRIVDER